MKARFDKTWLGTIIGILAPAIMFLIITRYYHMGHLSQLSSEVWIHLAAPKLLSLSVIPNLASFYLFIYTHCYKAARGVLGATVVFAVFVVILRFSV